MYLPVLRREKTHPENVYISFTHNGSLQTAVEFGEIFMCKINTSEYFRKKKKKSLKIKQCIRNYTIFRGKNVRQSVKIWNDYFIDSSKVEKFKFSKTHFSHPINFKCQSAVGCVKESFIFLSSHRI